MDLKGSSTLQVLLHFFIVCMPHGSEKLGVAEMTTARVKPGT
jgi:hypothetical protein